MTEGETSPPPLLTEADLISLMEKHGIGIYHYVFILMMRTCIPAILVYVLYHLNAIIVSFGNLPPPFLPNPLSHYHFCAHILVVHPNDILYVNYLPNSLISYFSSTNCSKLTTIHTIFCYISVILRRCLE